jgi:hypothetical protein
MTIRTAVWRVGTNPQQLSETALPTEQLLEDMIVASPHLLSDEWMIIGRQEDTGFSGRIDLLALAPDGSLILIELKRDRTPREVVAQAIDYAVWVERLTPPDIASIYSRFLPGRSLADDFRNRYGQALDEETLNNSHQIIIVAASLDESTERIVGYLSQREIGINVLCFQVFMNGDERLLSRTWLLDPVQTQVSVSLTSPGISEPWNGEFYCSFGEDGSRSWADAVEFGFICAGGGPWYSRTLQLLNPGDRVWVKIPDVGFVGVGRVTGRTQSATDFKITRPGGEFPILDLAKRGTYHRQFVDDSARSEYFVPIQWLETVSRERAIYEIGLFGNQNTICKPTTPKWRSTVERLKLKFPQFDGTKASAATVSR